MTLISFRPWAAGLGVLGLLFCGSAGAFSEDLITQEYTLKNTEAPMVIRVLLMVIPNPTGKHIISGTGKRIVLTDAIEQHAQLVELLPVIDQPSTETDEKRAYMMMVQNTMRFYRSKKVNYVKSRKKGESGTGPAEYRSPEALAAGVRSFDATKSTFSVYALEDARLSKQPRRIKDEPVLPSISDLKLKGLFETNKGAPIALLAYGDVIFTARDGGLFERNKVRVKGVISAIHKDHVTLTGADKIPRDIKFKSTL